MKVNNSTVAQANANTSAQRWINTALGVTATTIAVGQIPSVKKRLPTWLGGPDETTTTETETPAST